jgi:hypothetical protein
MCTTAPPIRTVVCHDPNEEELPINPHHHQRFSLHWGPVSSNKPVGVGDEADDGAGLHQVVVALCQLPQGYLPARTDNPARGENERETHDAVREVHHLLLLPLQYTCTYTCTRAQLNYLRSTSRTCTHVRER